MIERIFHLLSGYVEFRVKGDGARFFTVAAKRGFTMWGFRRQEGEAVARARPATYKKLRQVSGRCQVRTKIMRKGGLPFQVNRLWKRKSLLLGAAVGAGAYVFLSGYIWGVSLNGNENMTPLAVYQAAREYGVYVGAQRQALSPKAASHGILTELPGLSWVNVNTDGCFVEIAVKEGTAAPEVEDRKELSNIVAAREGQIVEIEAREGRPEVSLGETVTQGQLLIAGLYEQRPDPDTVQPPEIYRKAGPARGRVIAETYREFTVQASAQRTEEVEVERQVATWADVFGLRLPLGIWRKPQGVVRRYKESAYLTLLGTVLPVGVEREVTVLLEEETHTLSQEEQKAAALMKLREAQKAALPEGSSVKEEQLEYVFTEGMCILSAKCRCLEEIGVTQKISVE